MTPFVFVYLDEPHDLAHMVRCYALRDYFLRTEIALDVGFENRIQHIVRRQRILVGLVFAELRRWRARDDALRNHAAETVAVSREAIDERLADVLQNRKSAGHVAIERGIADRHLGLVARR